MQICRALVVSWTDVQYLFLQRLLLVLWKTSRVPAYKKIVHNSQTLPAGYHYSCKTYTEYINPPTL